MKTVTTKIICDSCGADISPQATGYPAVYILKVTAENVARHTENSVVFAVHSYPPIEHDLYFCNLECMRKYNE